MKVAYWTDDLTKRVIHLDLVAEYFSDERILGWLTEGLNGDGSVFQVFSAEGQPVAEFVLNQRKRRGRRGRRQGGDPEK